MVLNAAATPVQGLTKDEKATIDDLRSRLSNYQSKNKEALEYYEGTAEPAKLGITVPPQMRDTKICLGWCSKVVNTHNARLDFEGWASPQDSNPFGLRDVYQANYLDVLSVQAHLDALIFGVSFIVIGKGADGEPDPLITVESPLTMTANYSIRTRRLTSAISVLADDDEEQITLYLPNETVWLTRSTRNNSVTVIDRNIHNLGRVPVVAVANRARSNRPFGQSEMTKPIRNAQDEGIRTSLNMAVNSEFYAAPQRYALGADESSFMNGDGTPKSQWQLVQGRMLALSASKDEDGNPVGQLPQVGQFAQASPAPYIDILQQKAKQVASDADLPIRAFDENKNAPTSADAIRADESALVKSAERKQRQFSKAWAEVGYIALLVRDGKVPNDYASVNAQWAQASTPVTNASTDAVTKLISAGVVPAESEAIFKLLDFDNSTQNLIREDRLNAPPVPSDLDGQN